MLIMNLPGNNAIKVGRFYFKSRDIEDTLTMSCRLMRSNPTEKQLFELLSRDSAAHSHGLSGDIKAPFALMLDIGEKEAATGRIDEIPTGPSR